jgi:hypothetical protein
MKRHTSNDELDLFGNWKDLMGTAAGFIFETQSFRGNGE